MARVYGTPQDPPAANIELQAMGDITSGVLPVHPTTETLLFPFYQHT